jgi:oligopeptide transport system permease protein
MPGSPFNDEKLNPKQKELLYKKYGLDKPFYIRFLKYVGAMMQGDLGDSYVINKNKPVSEMVAGPLGVSIRIGLFGMILGSILGLLLGVTAALHHNSWVDSFSSVVSILGISVPSYVFALLLVYFIAYRMNLIPVLYTTKNIVGSHIGPMLALAMSPMASVSRFTRSEMIDVLGSDYVLLVKAKGVKQRDLIYRHALRNTLIPIITIMGPILVNLLTGSMVVEKVFGVPGIGTLMVTAIQSNDYNVVIACAFIYSAMYIVMMLIIDVLYGIIDPRIRVAKEN